MRALSRVLSVSALALGVAIGSGAPAWAATNTISTKRLEALPYQAAILSQAQAKVFTGTTSSDAEVKPVGPYGWQGRICNQPLPYRTEAAGRSVQYDPSDAASLVNYVVSINTPANAKAFMKTAKTSIASCDSPHPAPNGATYIPVTDPKLPKLGDERAALKGQIKLSNGTLADSMQIIIRKGQLINYVQMLSIAKVTPKMTASIAKSLDGNLDDLAKTAAKKPAKTRAKNAASTASACEDLFTQAQLEQAFGVPLTPPVDCTFELAEGAGGIDIAFKTAKNDAFRAFSTLAKGEPVQLNGARDALLASTRNSFGQLFDSLYVLTPNGNMFSISVRGDDAPTGQKAQIIAAANAALKTK